MKYLQRLPLHDNSKFGGESSFSVKMIFMSKVHIYLCVHAVEILVKNTKNIVNKNRFVD